MQSLKKIGQKLLKSEAGNEVLNDRWTAIGWTDTRTIRRVYHDFLNTFFVAGYKKYLCPLISCTFFQDFIHAYNPSRGRQPIWANTLMSTERPHHLDHLLQDQKNLFNLWFYKHLFIHDLINVYSCGSGAHNPLGTKCWCQQKPSLTTVICYKF